MRKTEKPSSCSPPSEDGATKSETGTSQSSVTSKQMKQEIQSSKLTDTDSASDMATTELERNIERMTRSTDRKESETGEKLYALLQPHNDSIEAAVVDDVQQDLDNLERRVGTVIERLHSATDSFQNLSKSLKMAVEKNEDLRAVLTDVDRQLAELKEIEDLLNEPEDEPKSAK